MKDRRRELRSRTTPAETILWKELRDVRFLRYPFRRQHSIGFYIVDFYCPKLKLVIEVDGHIHDLKERKEYDLEREAYLKGSGLQILRFANEQVMNDLDSVLEQIASFCYQ